MCVNGCTLSQRATLLVARFFAEIEQMKLFLGDYLNQRGLSFLR
ncbi:hypothetical protein O59_001764 [Cellvibrio sp. BR]|nr:hypothetical protein O59_001764 [Cellvibrio sp. BR]